MRSFVRFGFLVVLFLTASGYSVHAEPVTSLQAAQLLQQNLGSGKTLGSGEGADVLAAFSAAARQNPGLLAEMAALIAVARPDLVDSLKETIRRISPEGAASIIESMEQASINPSIDQLTSLASLEGIAPASGENEGSAPDNAGDSDLGWAGYGSGNGSPD